MSLLIRFCGISLVLTSSLLIGSGHAEEALSTRVEFNRDIRPILSDVCFHCHGPDAAQRKANLRFDTEAGALVDLGDGRRAIVAGQPDHSELIQRITSADPELRMPPPELERQLSPQQIDLLRRWIAQGAKWDAHWSFVTPVRAKRPVVSTTGWARSSVDDFVLARLEREGLTPSPLADKATLLRRLTLDLTGLPPTPSEVAEFLRDAAPDAWERVVDRLLASARYGERMAVRWLNGARYADTSGYQSDGERTMWRWRDWVIDAFNVNMPFDQFTVEQLAGDLLPKPILDQRIATGFNRNHRGNAEGGIIPEEYAVEYVVDRVETTSTVWLGLTVMCARCHNHKYDPITQTDFYQLFAFFNNIPEKGRAVKYGNSPPYLASPTRDQQRELVRWDQRVAAAEAAWAAVEPQVVSTQSSWEQTQVPDLAAADAVRRGLILHFPLDGNALAAVSTTSAAARPAGYLGQLRTSSPVVTNLPGSRSEIDPPQFVTSSMGQALDVDGQRDVAAGDVANFGFFDKFSLSAWIRPHDGLGGTILSRMTDLPHGDGWCVVLEQGKLQVHLTKRWLDDACRVETVEAIAAKGWQQVTVTYDGSRDSAGIQIYVDGRPQRTISLLNELNQSFDNIGLLRIGGGNGPAGRFHGLIDDVRIFDRVVSDEEAQILAQTDRLSAIAARPAADRTPSQATALRRYYVEHADVESIRSAWDQLQVARSDRAQFVEQLPTTMVMEELPSARTAHLLLRGEYDKPGERVSANVPASLPALPASEPRNRLTMARWLVSADHPLTSRVAVNRLWQMLFGMGIVKTVDDFGQQGEWPSHPELLDWLAVEFQQGSDRTVDQQPQPALDSESSFGRRAWDLKHLCRLIVTSATYRQSSRTSPELLRRDPENRWLARGPRFRLSAEMVRDQALAASGLLVEQLGGPSFKAYQPEGLWKDLAGIDYSQDHGANLYRRSLYIYWKRTIAPPSMITFDAVGRETCIVKETRTNTPLQALNLMNDVTYGEAARVLGERMLIEGGAVSSQRISVALQYVLGRPARPLEMAVLTAGYERHLSYYRDHRAQADVLTRQGEFPRNAQLDVSELAACTTIAGLILNLDEAVTCE